jgi:hypothetical protein
MYELGLQSQALDVIVDVDGSEVTAELAIANNNQVQVGDRYTAQCTDGAVIVLRVKSFKSAQGYTPTVARHTDAMREGVTGTPRTPEARKAFQTKLAILVIEGELLPDGTRRVGAVRTPDVMVPIRRVSDDEIERFVANTKGNLVLGKLRSGSRTISRLARIEHNFAGERMIVLGMPGKGKSQLIRALISQAMADSTIHHETAF